MKLYLKISHLFLVHLIRARPKPNESYRIQTIQTQFISVNLRFLFSLLFCFVVANGRFICSSRVWKCVFYNFRITRWINCFVFCFIEPFFLLLLSSFTEYSIINTTITTCFRSNGSHHNYSPRYASNWATSIQFTIHNQTCHCLAGWWGQKELSVASKISIVLFFIFVHKSNRRSIIITVFGHIWTTATKSVLWFRPATIYRSNNRPNNLLMPTRTNA